MEILSMPETRGQFPKEITKAREVMERPFSQLESLVKIICSQGRNKFCHASMQLCTWEVQGLRKHEDEALGSSIGSALWGYLEALLIAVVETPRGPQPHQLAHTHVDF